MLGTPAPTSPAPIWVELGPRGEVRERLRRLFQVTPALAVRILSRDGRYLLHPEPAGDERAQVETVLRDLPRLGAAESGSDVPVLAFALEVRPRPAPTPPVAALLGSGGALLAIAREDDSKDLGIRTFGRGAATYALVDRPALLPAGILRRPDVTRLWMPAPGIYSECGFEPVFPARAVSRWLAPGELIIFRNRGGNLHARGATPLPAGTPLVALRPPPVSAAVPAVGLVPMRLEVGLEEAVPQCGSLIESPLMPAFQAWVVRAPRPLLDGMSLYVDRRFCLVLRSADAAKPPVGMPLRCVEEGGRRAVLGAALRIEPRVAPGTFLDTVGARSSQVVLVRRDPQGSPVATAIPAELFQPLDRRNLGALS
jgi:hypothetical protein